MITKKDLMGLRIGDEVTIILPNERKIVGIFGCVVGPKIEADFIFTLDKIISDSSDGEKLPFEYIPSKFITSIFKTSEIIRIGFNSDPEFKLNPEEEGLIEREFAIFEFKKGPNENKFFLSADIKQFINDDNYFKHLCHIPHRVAPRLELMDGIIKSVYNLLKIYFKHKIQIPNPDPDYEYQILD